MNGWIPRENFLRTPERSEAMLRSAIPDMPKNLLLDGITDYTQEGDGFIARLTWSTTPLSEPGMHYVGRIEFTREQMISKSAIRQHIASEWVKIRAEALEAFPELDHTLSPQQKKDLILGPDFPKDRYDYCESYLGEHEDSRDVQSQEVRIRGFI